MKKLTFLILTVMSFLFILVFAAGSKGDSVTRDIAFETQKLQILKCESGYLHDNLWGAHGEYGIGQFLYPTFRWMAELAGRPELKWKSKKDQLWLFDWALGNGYASHWTCADKTKLAKVKKRNIAKKIQMAGVYVPAVDTLYSISMVDA
jgi:hypothetical protein